MNIPQPVTAEEHLQRLQQAIAAYGLSVAEEIHNVAVAKHRLQKIRTDRASTAGQTSDAAIAFRSAEAKMHESIRLQVSAYGDMFDFVDQQSQAVT